MHYFFRGLQLLNKSYQQKSRVIFKKKFMRDIVALLLQQKINLHYILQKVGINKIYLRYLFLYVS